MCCLENLRRRLNNLIFFFNLILNVVTKVLRAELCVSIFLKIKKPKESHKDTCTIDSNVKIIQMSYAK